MTNIPNLSLFNQVINIPNLLLFNQLTNIPNLPLFTIDYNCVAMEMTKG